MQAERRQQPKRLAIRLYVGATAVGGVATAIVALRFFSVPSWRTIVFFYVLHLLALTSAVEVPIGSVSPVLKPQRAVTLSPGFIVLLTAVFTGKPTAAVVVALIPSISLSKWREHPDVARLVFNSAQEAVSFGGAALVFSIVHSAAGGLVALFGAAIAAAATASILNTVIVAGIVSIDRKMRIYDVLRRMAWVIPHSLSFALAALLVSTLYVRFGPAATIFLFMPLAALRFVRQSKLDLDAAHDRAIREFVRAVDRKDPYTRNHSERVAEIVLAMHRELGSTERELSRRYLAALLHDVGKVVVRAEVLTKAGALTAHEYDEVKRHVTAGASAISQIDFLADLAEEVLLHHERLDGTGYPFGFGAADIPRNVRILSVADCFEAMTSARVYRRALTVSEATAELQRVAGTQLDPEMVGALIRVIEGGVAFASPPAPVSSLPKDDVVVGSG